MRNKLGLPGAVGAVLAGLLLSVAAATPALAAKPVNPGSHGGGGGGSTPAGYDVSWPQCSGALPTNPLFGIVGTDDGLAYSANPCLGTEFTWADQASGGPAFYANTGDPGPVYSSYWDVTSWHNLPKSCSANDDNTPDCSYDYGWYAAKNSFANALGVTPSAASYPWWLDVETGNSWQSQESAYSGNLTSAYANDTAELQGEVAYLQDQGVPSVGFYSTSYQWGQITGSASFGPSYPDWLAGYRTLRFAQSACTPTTGFSGGTVKLTQYPQSGFDADYACP